MYYTSRPIKCITFLQQVVSFISLLGVAIAAPGYAPIAHAPVAVAHAAPVAVAHAAPAVDYFVSSLTDFLLFVYFSYTKQELCTYIVATKVCL